MRSIYFVAAALAATPLCAQTPAPAPAAAPAAAPAPMRQLPADSLALARRYAGFITASQADSLFAVLSPPMQSRMGSVDQLRAQMDGLASQAGTETSMTEERWVSRGGQRQYWRFSNFSAAPEQVVIRLVIGPDGLVTGIGISPASQLPPVDP